MSNGVGIALILVSALAMAAVPALAKLAYSGGSDPATVIVLRGIVMLALAGGWHALSRDARRMDRTAFLGAAAMGLNYVAMAYGLLAAVQSIPIGLTVVIFFTHPLFVAVLAHLLGGERLTTARALCGLTVVVGVAMAVGAELGTLDPVGIALAFMASLTCAVMIVGNARLLGRADSLSINLVMVAAATLLMTAICLLATGFAWPRGAIGWIGVLGVGIGFTLGLLLFFAAIARIGAVRPTMISSIEPALAMLLGALAFGERPSAVQIAGVAILIGGLLLFEWPWRRAAVAGPD